MFAILSTKTPHHVFFENKIFKKFNNLVTIYETKLIKPKFSTKVKFEIKRDNYEKKIFFKGKSFRFLSKAYKVRDINDHQTNNILKKNKIKYILVFGTKKINSNILKNYKNRIYNLHGGDPQEYRGLDSHYWSIYHGNFKLHSCLHKLNNKLDDGKIIYINKLLIKKNLKIFQLRKINTINCIKMTLKLFEKLSDKKKIKLLRQKKIGGYYSFMPSELKKIVEKKFNNRNKFL